MKSSTTAELRNPNSLRAKYALRTAIVLALAFLGTFGLYLYLAQSIKAWQLYILADVTAFVSLLNILALWYALKKRIENLRAALVRGTQPIGVFWREKALNADDEEALK